MHTFGDIVIVVNLEFHILPLPPHSITDTKQTVLGVGPRLLNYSFEKFLSPCQPCLTLT